MALVKEIGSALSGTYVNNIYSIGEAQLVRLKRPESEDVWLVVSPKYGVWVSGKVSERGETKAFTTGLRGQLERARFVGASQADLDRVFQLDFEKGGAVRVVVEMMPPGNLVVTDSGGKMLLIQREVRSQARRLVRGGVYQAPAQRRKSPVDVKAGDIAAMASKEDTAGKAVGKHIALPRKYVGEALQRLGLTDDSPSALLRGREGELADRLAEMVEEAAERPRPCVFMTRTGEEIGVIRPKGAEVKHEAGSVSELCDMLFLGAIMDEGQPSAPEDQRRREVEVTIAKLKEEQASLREEAARARAAALSAGGLSMEEGLRLVKEAGARSSRDLRSAAAVASALFDHAKELEARASQAGEAAARLEKKLPKLPSKPQPRTAAISRRKQEWYEKFRWFVTTEGRLAVGGRDAQTNSALVNRHLDDNDVVYHADLFGSPFFILKGGKTQSEAETRQMALATVAFSSAWKTGLGAADAYWVSPGQVSTAAPTGEYLAKGSFAIRGKKNFVTKNLVEVAVGLDGSGRVVSGPEDAIRALSGRYVVLRPQKEKASDTAKKVLRELQTEAGGEGRRISVDDVLRALPAGGGKVVRRSKP